MPGAVTYDEYGRPIDPNALAMNRATARPVQEADTVYGSTAPTWDPGAYNAAMMGSATGYANGGAVRQNFRGGGIASGPALELAAKSRGLWADEERALRLYQAQKAQEPLPYDPSYDAPSGSAQGTNAALGGAGSVGNDPNSMQRLADYSGASAGYAEGGVVDGGSRFYAGTPDSPGNCDSPQHPTSGKPCTSTQLSSVKSAGVGGTYLNTPGSNYAEGGAVEDPLPTTDPYASFANMAAPVTTQPNAAGLGYFSSGRAMGQPAADDDGQAQSDQNAQQAAKPLAKGKRGKKKRARTGYAEGGAVDDADSQSTPEYELQRRLQEQARQQQELTAQQQAVTAQRNAEVERQAGGDLPAQPRTAPENQPVVDAELPVSKGTPEYERQVATQAPEQARQAAAQQRQSEIEQQAGGNQQTQLQPQTEAARQTELATQATEAKQVGTQADNAAQVQSAAGTPWYKQVYNHLVSGLEQATAGTTGYFDPRRDAGPPTQSGTAELEGTFKNALNPFHNDNPYLSNPISEAVDSTKDRIHKFLNGDGAHSVDEITKMITEDPNRNPDQHIQKKWDDLELSGNKEEAGRLLQTIRNGMNSRFGFASAAIDKGDIDTAMHAFAQGNNLLPNGMLYTPVKSPDGQYGFKLTPQKPGMGEEKVIWGSPAQMRDLIKTANPDNLMQNGLESLHGAVSGQAKEVPKGYEDPRVNYANRPGYRDNRPVDAAGNEIASTANGFHPDSHMGLMDRAQEAQKSGRPDPKAEQYLARAQAAVRAGIAPADVPDALRKGFDPFAKPAGDAAPTNAPVPGGVARVGGKITYDPIYDIPGSRSPDTPLLVSGVDPGDTRRIGAGDTFRSREAERHAQSTESHETHDAKGGGGSGRKQSTDDSSDVSNTLYPKEHWREPDPIPYAYGERRAGSQAQGRPEDYAPLYKQIPGSNPPPVEPDPHPGFTGLKSVTDEGGMDVTRQQNQQASSTSKSGSSQSSSSDTGYTRRPPSYFENSASRPENQPLPRPYASQRLKDELARPDDYRPIPEAQKPSAQTPQRDIFQEVRTPGRALPTAPQYDAPRADKEAYNAQLQELRGQVGTPSTGTAYDARNRQLNETSGYAASQDRRAAELKQATAKSDADYKAMRAEEDRVRSKYGYYNPELAAQDKAGTAPPIRYTDDWRHVPRPPTAQEQAQDIAAPRKLELKTAPAQIQATGRENVADINQAGRLQTTRERNQSRETIATGQNQSREGIAAGQNQSREGIAAGQNQSRETVAAGQNQSREGIAAAQRQMLESKQTQDILARRGSDDLKQSMAVLQTKLRNDPKSITPEEMDNYNTLVQAVQAEQNQPRPAAGPAGAPAGAPAAAPAAAPTSAAGPVQIKSDEEYTRLPPNTTYIDPNGILRRKG